MKTSIRVLAMASVLAVSALAQENEKVAPTAKGSDSEEAAIAALRERAGKIVIPKVELKGASVAETLEFLRAQAAALAPQGKGINIVELGSESSGPLPPELEPPALPLDIPLPPGIVPGPQSSGIQLTLSLMNVPLPEALKYVANLANFDLRWDEDAVVLLPSLPDGKREPRLRPEIHVAAGEKAKLVLNKLQKIRLPKVDFREAICSEAVDYLTQRLKLLDPEPVGIDQLLAFDLAGNMPPASPRRARLDGVMNTPRPPISLSLTDISLLECSRYIAEAEGLEIVVDETGIVFVPSKLAARARVNIIRKLDLQGASLDEALNWLQALGQRTDPDGKATPMVLVGPKPVLPPSNDPVVRQLNHPAEPKSEPAKDPKGAKPRELAITLLMTKVPLSEAVQKIAELADCDVRWDENAVVLSQRLPGWPKLSAVRPPFTLNPGAEKMMSFLLQLSAFPKLEVKEGTLHETAEFLNTQFKSLDPERRLNWILKADGSTLARSVAFSASKLPAFEAIRYATEFGGVDLKIDPYGLYFVSRPQAK